MIAVELIGIQVDPISGAAAVVLREHDAPNRLLPIVVGQADASSIAIAASGTQLPRPMTHDLMASVVDAVLDGHLDSVEVTELHEGAFLANLTLSGPAGQRRVDTRPSDAIAVLAVRLQAPLFVKRSGARRGRRVLPIEDAAVDQFAARSVDRRRRRRVSRRSSPNSSRPTSSTPPQPTPPQPTPPQPTPPQPTPPQPTPPTHTTAPDPATSQIRWRDTSGGPVHRNRYAKRGVSAAGWTCQWEPGRTRSLG